MFQSCTKTFRTQRKAVLRSNLLKLHKQNELEETLLCINIFIDLPIAILIVLLQVTYRRKKLPNEGGSEEQNNSRWKFGRRRRRQIVGTREEVLQESTGLLRQTRTWEMFFNSDVSRYCSTFFCSVLSFAFSQSAKCAISELFDYIILYFITKLIIRFKLNFVQYLFNRLEF